MLDRRRFLRIVAVGGAATACSGPLDGGPRVDPLPTGAAATALPETPAPSANTPPGAPVSSPPAAPDWAALAAGLSGPLLRPDDGGYDQARRLYNTRFDQIRPQAVARCANAQDVRECVDFARRSGVPLALRSGGHSYAGWSSGTGLVVDVGRIAGVRVDGDRVVVGAGARLIDVYAGVAAAGRGVPAGSCPTVGVTGLALGGGVGVLTRVWGLTCDNLLAADVVTADGRLVTADARREPDLYWALRGGGGGNFGAVTSLTLRTHPAGSMSMVFLSWPWSLAATVVGAWQDWLPGLPDATWSNVHLLTGASGAPRLTLNAFHLGDAATAGRLVDRLVGAVGSEPSSRSTVTEPYLTAMRRLAGCADRTTAQCHLPDQNPQGTLGRETYAAKSHVLGAPLSAAGIAALVSGVDRLARDPRAGSGGVQLDALGGAVARVAPDATAFVHRRALATAQYLVSWSPGDSSTAAGSVAWLRSYRDSMTPHAGNGAYVNYVDPDLRDFGTAYHGANLARLRRVKAAYDPGRLFTFPQAITP